MKIFEWGGIEGFLLHLGEYLGGRGNFLMSLASSVLVNAVSGALAVASCTLARGKQIHSYIYWCTS